jgi:hypothetical protein
MRTEVHERTKRNPRGAGRNPRGAGASTPITLRLTDDERRRYQVAADSAGVSLADWIRGSCEVQLAKKARRS